MELKPIHKARLEALANWLEKGGESPHIQFGMYTYLTLLDEDGNETFDENQACGSVCCMAGALAQTFGNIKTTIHGHGIFDVARELVGLNLNDAVDLFVPALDLHSITPRQAARVVRHLLATGEIDWSIRGAP